MTPAVPEELIRRYRGSRQGRDWLESLPGRLASALDGLGLEPDPADAGRAWHGRGALVVPVRGAAGPAVLKFAYPHPEAAAEATALQLWDGAGAVRLLSRDAPGGCLVLERLAEGRSLLTEDMDTAIAEWGRLIRVLSLPAGDGAAWAELPSAAARAEQLSDEIPADWEALGRPFERWLMEAALETAQTRGAVGRRSSNDVLLHADLHYGNILLRPEGRPDPGGFVAIDPQAMVGEAEFAVAPMLWNRLDELDGERPAADLRRRLAALCRAGGLDERAAVEWAILREVRNALDYFLDGVPAEAQRSIWVASALTGRLHPGLPPVRLLPAP